MGTLGRWCGGSGWGAFKIIFHPKRWIIQYLFLMFLSIPLYPPIYPFEGWWFAPLRVSHTLIALNPSWRPMGLSDYFLTGIITPLIIEVTPISPFRGLISKATSPVKRPILQPKARINNYCIKLQHQNCLPDNGAQRCCRPGQAARHTFIYIIACCGKHDAFEDQTHYAVRAVSAEQGVDILFFLIGHTI